jgi:hypothetical protein
MNMNETQLKKYLTSTTFFKLKDLDKTTELYKDYKNDKFNKFLEEENNLDTCEDFKCQFSYSFNYYRNTQQAISENPSKSNIRSYATEINSIMRQDLENYLVWACDDLLNDNEKRSFTIKFYLKFYKEINEAMTEILQEQIIGCE